MESTWQALALIGDQHGRCCLWLVGSPPSYKLRLNSRKRPQADEAHLTSDWRLHEGFYYKTSSLRKPERWLTEGHTQRKGALPSIWRAAAFNVGFKTESKRIIWKQHLMKSSRVSFITWTRTGIFPCTRLCTHSSSAAFTPAFCSKSSNLTARKLLRRRPGCPVFTAGSRCKGIRVTIYPLAAIWDGWEMDRRWADASFVTEGEVSAGVEGCCHLFGWRTARLIKQQSDRANLIPASGAQGERRAPKISKHRWACGL